MSVEFVDQAKAEALGAEFVALDNASHEAKVDSWFVMQAIADQVGPASNVGVRGLSWRPKTGTSRTDSYCVSLKCVDGHLHTSIGGPGTLRDARSVEWLRRAQATMDRKVAELGGLVDMGRRHSGTSDALVMAVEASPEGRVWSESRKRPGNALLTMVKVADVYGREGVNPAAGLSAHRAFMPFEDRARLVREFPAARAADAKVMSLRNGTTAAKPHAVSASTVKSLATRTGTTRREARVVLQAAIDGRSERKLMRLVREAVRTANSMQEVAA